MCADNDISQNNKINKRNTNYPSLNDFVDKTIVCIEVIVKENSFAIPAMQIFNSAVHVSLYCKHIVVHILEFCATSHTS